MKGKYGSAAYNEETKSRSSRHTQYSLLSISQKVAQQGIMKQAIDQRKAEDIESRRSEILSRVSKVSCLTPSMVSGGQSEITRSTDRHALAQLQQ